MTGTLDGILVIADFGRVLVGPYVYYSCWITSLPRVIDGEVVTYLSECRSQ